MDSNSSKHQVEQSNSPYLFIGETKNEEKLAGKILLVGSENNFKEYIYREDNFDEDCSNFFKEETIEKNESSFNNPNKLNNCKNLLWESTTNYPVNKISLEPEEIPDKYYLNFA